ncbi:MAG: YgfZ/GcvT domain-containing protein [Acidobacteriota bacterium]
MSANPAPAGGPAAGAADQYRAARSSAVLADRSDLGRLVISGRDAADLLHRLTTNATRDLRDGDGVPTVFVTPKGRIVDLVTLHRMSDHLLCLTGRGRAAAVAAWIDRYTFREEVRVEDRGAALGILGLYGARASEAVAALFGEAAAARPRHHTARVGSAEDPVAVAPTYPLAGGGFLLIVRRGALDALRRRILGSRREVIAAGEACLEALRIESGLPAAGRELTEDYNPWEARLDEAVSLTKGCYVGQEVIARLNTYAKVTKRLVRLELPGPGVAPAGGRASRLSR